ncbi:MAG: hypothetical protein ACI90R_000624, partial [Alteromonas macleodii]
PSLLAYKGSRDLLQEACCFAFPPKRMRILGK